MVTIAVDAMGGDHAPNAEVEGSIQAARTLGVKIILVGYQDIVRKELAQHQDIGGLPIEIQHASQHITMEDSAAKAVRTKRDSSIRVAARLVRDGIAQGVVSAGNTGAVMATAKMVQGMLPGVDRPALASAFPTLKGRPVVVVDVGANVDCSARMLAQFAVMGDIYSRVAFRTHKPRVGLLSIGEEEHKGNELTRTATPLLKELPINFIGNVEGSDIFAGETDVIVCDGFIGNVALKVSCATVRREPPRQRRTDMLRAVMKMLSYWRATLVGQAILPAAAFQAAVPDGAPIFRLGRRRLKAGGSQDWLPHILLVLITGLAPPLGVVEDPVHWTLTFDSKSVPPGSKFIGHLTAKIDPGWHLYSLTTPRPPIATTTVLADNPAVAGVKVYQPKPLIKLDPTFQVNTETFGDEVTVLSEIELT